MIVGSEMDTLVVKKLYSDKLVSSVTKDPLLLNSWRNKIAR